MFKRYKIAGENAIHSFSVLVRLRPSIFNPLVSCLFELCGGGILWSATMRRASDSRINGNVLALVQKGANQNNLFGRFIALKWQRCRCWNYSMFFFFGISMEQNRRYCKCAVKIITLFIFRLICYGFSCGIQSRE